jgi:hypothetical protein
MKSDFVINSRIGIGVYIFEEPNLKQGFLIPFMGRIGNEILEKKIRTES